MTMKRLITYPALFMICAWLASRLLVPASAVTLKQPVPAPEFTHRQAIDWINSGPLEISHLGGKVVLIDFWTYGCWNCYRSFPWLKAMEERLENESFQVIGVHTPEFDREKILGNVTAKVKEFGLEHPIMIDNDFSYWQAMGNRYWPAFYLIDKSGYVRYAFFGETHEGDPRALEIEKAIRELLNEDS